MMTTQFSCQHDNNTGTQGQTYKENPNPFADPDPDVPNHHNKKTTYVTDLSEILPKNFYNKKVAQDLKDSFGIENPSTLLLTQARALKEEQVHYGYRWYGVGVGYGMMPACGNVWERVIFGGSYTEKQAQGIIKKVKKLLMFPLTSNRDKQTELYNYSKKVMDSAFASKPDTAQALDMFAIWKTIKYLGQYDYDNECARTKKYYYRYDSYYKKTFVIHSFTLTDWRNKKDSDAKLYAFWHRRISENKKYGIGFSLNDARYWTDVAFAEMTNLSKPGTQKILSYWEKLWEEGKITAPYQQ